MRWFSKLPRRCIRSAELRLLIVWLLDWRGGFPAKISIDCVYMSARKRLKNWGNNWNILEVRIEIRTGVVSSAEPLASSRFWKEPNVLCFFCKVLKSGSTSIKLIFACITRMNNEQIARMKWGAMLSRSAASLQCAPRCDTCVGTAVMAVFPALHSSRLLGETLTEQHNFFFVNVYSSSVLATALSCRYRERHVYPAKVTSAKMRLLRRSDKGRRSATSEREFSNQPSKCASPYSNGIFISFIYRKWESG